MHRPHNIGGISFDWINIRAAHQRLRRRVDDDVRRGLAHGIGQYGAIADVADDGCHALSHLRHLKQARVGGRLQRIAGNVCTELLLPQAQPASLKAGVAGNKYFFATPK